MMGLVDKDNTGEAQLFSPTKVACPATRSRNWPREGTKICKGGPARKDERLRAREMKHQKQETWKRGKEEER